MIVKAINKSKYTLHYIVFNKKIHQKSHFKIRSSSDTIRKLSFFFFFFKLASYKNKLANEGFQCSVGILENTEQLPNCPSLSKLLFGTCGKKKQSKPLHFGPWIQLGIRQRRKCWLGSSGKSVHSLPSGIFGKCCNIRFLACPESSLPHASLPTHSSGLKPTKLLIVFAPAVHESVGTWVPPICRLSSLPSLWDWAGVAECGGSQSSVDITVTWKSW